MTTDYLAKETRRPGPLGGRQHRDGVGTAWRGGQRVQQRGGGAPLQNQQGHWQASGGEWRPPPPGRRPAGEQTEETAPAQHQGRREVSPAPAWQLLADQNQVA
jgi:hypothetical protein